ncbi:hypothetical protein KIN20_013289 [Parelaphostrongylus tenuis]|nr:hypothetical protein KIN20_013289 [Parelaphostrongylus tenuis]
MLLKFQLSLDQMSIVADEGARLANLCSTRMGRAQQMCKERADAIMTIDSFLRNTSEMEKKIRDLSKQVDKLSRFCNQAEQAMTYLDALCHIVRDGGRNGLVTRAKSFSSNNHQHGSKPCSRSQHVNSSH